MKGYGMQSIRVRACVVSLAVLGQVAAAAWAATTPAEPAATGETTAPPPDEPVRDEAPAKTPSAA